MYNAVADPMDGVVDLLGTADIMASLSLWDHLSIGIGLPLHLHRSGPASAGLADFTLGDLRTSIKAAIYRPRMYGMGVAVSLEIAAPTGGGDGLTAEKGVTLRPRVIFEATNRWVQSSLNVAYLHRFDDIPNLYSHELQFLFGLGIALWGEHALQLIVEADFASRLERFFANDSTRLELDLGLRYRLENGLAIQAGGGLGVMDAAGNTGYGRSELAFLRLLRLSAGDLRAQGPSTTATAMGSTTRSTAARTIRRTSTTSKTPTAARTSTTTATASPT